jgi:hypothetical protein
MDGDGERVERVRDLLSRAKKAHGLYETEVLGGVYDEAWAAWYAQYLNGNSLRDVLGGGDWSDERVAAMLTEADEMHRANAPESDWQEYYARRFVEQSNEG